MIYVSAKFSVKDECIEDFRQKARILVAENGMEDENVACNLFESIERKNTFTIMEVWNDMDTFEMYRQTDRYKELVSALKSYASQDVKADIFKMVI
ncbi:Quinol monooxygenase YgiN [Peptoclostridium litorale DSM 5388]|uniref:ABM domain-containing protein n=1 Tax=Peptoclostridium litorale DSM 5388 TaxID=1121324 RepID=A0A069RQM1_PEPLI|nr:antibiotic biosynthesis monooxygenase [Peptoclostridium litorale]KDR96472.1 hypothetical protein CLIT_2c00780 [Peptoclostridium litorale DSM 5388]SIN70193.1 Quinol monooxygenase YgiN [Peptoclostridium litorale DSM 5388]